MQFSADMCAFSKNRKRISSHFVSMKPFGTTNISRGWRTTDFNLKFPIESIIFTRSTKFSTKFRFKNIFFTRRESFILRWKFGFFSASSNSAHNFCIIKRSMRKVLIIIFSNEIPILSIADVVIPFLFGLITIGFLRRFIFGRIAYYVC